MKFTTTTNCQSVDSLLWNQFKEGSKEALSQIYLANYSLLYDYGYRICCNSSLIEDCIQDMFLGLWSKRSTIGQARSIKSYLISCLRRRLLEALAKSDKLRSHSIYLAEFHPNIVFSPEDFVISEEISSIQRNQLIRNLNKLTRRQREVIYFRYYDELTYQEISDILGINYQSVINILYRSYQVLKKSPLLKEVAEISF